MSDAGTNFISDRFRKFCSSLNIKEAVSSDIIKVMDRSKPALN